MPFRNTFNATAPGLVILLSASVAASPVWAQSFVIQDGQTVTTQQTLNNNGDTGVIESGGALNTAGDAIRATGDNASVDNKGTISITGNFADGIDSTGTGASIVNSGAISATGNTADGIQSTGTGASIVNSGAISTTGSSGRGIRSTSTGASIVNSGSISTAGISADGIFSTGTGISIVNSGAIATTGASAQGILSSGAGASIVNNGSILTTGGNADGIQTTGNNESIANTGTITVTGAGSRGVRFDGIGSTLTNTGTIIAKGSATEAIVGSVNAQTLNIGNGSQIIGTIDLQGGTDTVNITGNGPASRITFVNTEVINLQPGIAGVVTGSTVTTVDPTGFSKLGVAQNTVTAGIHSTIDNRIHAAPDSGIQLASAEPTFASDGDAPESGPHGLSGAGARVWGEVFGGELTREGEGETLPYTQKYLGIVAGIDRVLGGRGLGSGRYGLTLGYAESDLKTDTTSVETDVQSLFGGVYGQTDLGGNLTLGTNLIVGYEDYDTSRRVADNLNGFETAQAAFSNVFVSPSASLHYERPVAGDLYFRPSGALVYTASFFEGYTETGTTASNLAVERRTVHTVNARAELALAKVFRDAHVFEFRIGLDGRFSEADDIEASLAGNSFRFVPSDDRSVMGGYIGARAEIAAAERWALIGDLEHRRASGGERELSARFRTRFTF